MSFVRNCPPPINSRAAFCDRIPRTFIKVTAQLRSQEFRRLFVGFVGIDRTLTVSEGGRAVVGPQMDLHSLDCCCGLDDTNDFISYAPMTS